MIPTRRPELIPAQRRAFMLEHIRKRGGASIQELSEAIGISLSTVRRDLEHLEERGYLERSHGGALIQKQLQSTFEPEAAITAEFDRLEKESIGLAAAATLHSGASVIFDSSSTVLAAARASLERDIAPHPRSPTTSASARLYRRQAGFVSFVSAARCGRNR